MRSFERINTRLLLGLFAALLVACGSDAETPKQPNRLNGRIIHAADVPDMRLRDFPPLLTDAAFVADCCLGGIFKDPPEKVTAKLKEAGFKRAIGEIFTGSGTTAAAAVLELGSDAQATSMLEYMYQELFEQCPGVTKCAEQSELTVSGIPGAKGQQVTPVREEGRTGTEYKVLFTIGPVVYAILVGAATDFYDPGAVPRETALAAFRAVYQRVKGTTAERLFPSPSPFTPCPPGPAPCPFASPTG